MVHLLRFLVGGVILSLLLSGCLGKNVDPIQVLKSTKNPDKDVQLAAVNKNGAAIEYIQNPDKDVQFAAVNKYGAAIKYIRNPDKDVQLAAVNKYGYAIEYIQNPDKDVQLAAVKASSDANYYIKNLDNNVLVAAVNKYGDAIKYIQNPDKDVQLAAVKASTSAIGYIKNPDKDVQLAAVKAGTAAIYYIKNPYPSVALYVNGSATISQKSVGYIASDKNLSIILKNNSEITISNSTNSFINVKSLAEYFGKDISMIKNILVPPKGEVTILAPNKKDQIISSMNDKITYGFAVDYTVAESDKNISIFKTKAFAISELFE
ncbi:MAG: DUF4116 domain-containing protein [Campylobacterales bacterium]|nr:DUF4116 domain-containing protein [Campylobacterales bacterium]